MIPRLPKGFSHPVKVGTGGFGSVYRVRQNALGRNVALKFIDEKDLDARSTLKKEASMHAGLHIQGIPQIYDVMEFSGRICIVMQWIKGCGLRDLFEQGLSAGYRFAIATEIIKIVASLHAQGFAHRDIKPENILISGDGVYIIDFGLARNVLKDRRKTESNIINGTPEYMAPEILKGLGATADPFRADMYSLGKVVRELLGNEPACIAGALAQEPGQRPKTAGELLLQWDLLQHPQHTPDWSAIIEPCMSESLAKRLYDATLLLLTAGKNEEAYTLLVECLRTFPEFPGALGLMEKFPLIKKRHSVYWQYRFAAGGVASLVLILIAAIVLTNTHRVTRQNSNNPSTNGESRTLFIATSSAAFHHTDRTLPLKEEPIPIHVLCGTLKVQSRPPNGALEQNHLHISVDSSGLRMPAPCKENTFFWRAADGGIIWKEVIMALPFQEMRLCIKEH